MTTNGQNEDYRSARRSRANQRAQSTYNAGPNAQRVSRESRQLRSHEAYRNQSRENYARNNYQRSHNVDTGAYHQAGPQASQYCRANYGVQRNSAGHYNRDAYGREVKKMRKTPLLPKIGIFLAVVLLAVGGFYAYQNFGPIKVTVNGSEYELSDNKTVGGAIAASKVTVTPGNLLAVDDSVITQGGGTAFTAVVNGQETTDASYKLTRGAVVEIKDGTNITEEYTSTEEEIPATVQMTGTGAIHKFEGDGTPGIKSVMTGKISGITTAKVTREPSNITSHAYNVDTGGEKIVAITIDDGPWPSSTKQILDILEENDAVATFFVVGNVAEGQTEGYNLLKREQQMGCQVCTHTYDHASGSGQGVNITYMTAAEQVEEIEKGRQVITDATGQEASRVVRMPGGNLNAATVQNLYKYVDAEIGWNLDTEDWRRPGSDSIYNVFMQAYPGAVILCHDGGGDRSQTVEALRRAIPDLKAKGYRFVTIDQLMQYPESSKA